MIDFKPGAASQTDELSQFKWSSNDFIEVIERNLCCKKWLLSLDDNQT